MTRRTRQPTIRPTVAPAAELTAAIAPAVLHAVVHDHRRLGPAMADALKNRERSRDAKDRAGIARSLRALLRWWGWIETLHLRRPEEQLLLASLLEFPEVSAFARVWAERIGRPVDRLVPVGDAPGWTARAEGLKRWLGGQAVNADPWRLFPAWIRDQLPVPPGDATPKTRRLDFLGALQSRGPTWVAVRGADVKAIWAELREAELKPWIHRRLPDAAKLPAEVDLGRVASFEAGRLVVQDLASQAVGMSCDPDPGERWWDVRGDGDGGLNAFHLAALMGGKGSIVCTFETERRRHEAALRLRRGAFHNITTKVSDRHHTPGKAASFDGVIVDAPSSGVGTWRRHPDARWTVSAEQIPRLAAEQAQLLDIASTRVRPGGTLVYTVSTLTRAETAGVVEAFLQSHPEYQLQPFPHPLEDTTTGGTLLIWPQLHDCDGRFIARMIRSTSAAGS
jgi:16S rRNA (cytosine967-C5)-methyltransferase